VETRPYIIILVLWCAGFVSFLKLYRDLDILWAVAHALAAFDTLCWVLLGMGEELSIEECLGLALIEDADCIVVILENARDINAHWTWHTICTACACNESLLVPFFSCFVISLELFFCKMIWLVLIKSLEVFLNVFNAGAAGEHYCAFRLVDKPCERLFAVCFARNLCKLFSYIFRWCLAEHTAAEGFHDDYRETLCACVLETFFACLIILVKVVVLHHADIPVVSVNNFLPVAELTMAGEADELCLAGFLLLLHKFDSIELLYLCPVSFKKVVEKIDIEIVCLESFELFVHELLKVFFTGAAPDRKLCYKLYLFTVAVSESFADYDFRARINVSCVDIVYTAVDSCSDDIDSFLFVDDFCAVFKLYFRESHTAEAETRYFKIVFAEFNVLHTVPP